MLVGCVFVLLGLSFAEAARAGDGKAPVITLNDGNLMPTLGLGTFLGFDEKGQKPAAEREVTDSVRWALEAEYRLVDTASAYKDEEQVGQGVAEWNKSRADVFIVTKLSTTEQRDVLGALRGSLKRLNMDYVDLYLIHFPIAFTPDHSKYDIIDYLDTWKSIEEAKKLGLAKSIGISNFNVSQIQRLLDHCEVKPAVLQVEVNLNLAQEELFNFCKSKDIAVMAYSPFGSLFSKSDLPPPPRVDDPLLQDLATKYGKSAAQIVLRYLVQRGVIPIPKSVHKERIEANINIFDFELKEEDMNTLAKFNKNYRIVNPSFWQDHPYYPFEKVENPGPNPFEALNKVTDKTTTTVTDVPSPTKKMIRAIRRAMRFAVNL